MELAGQVGDRSEDAVDAADLKSFLKHDVGTLCFLLLDGETLSGLA
jgi:hypothetical protein